MEHFVFWGLFLAFFVIILLYWIWMIRAERREAESTIDGPLDGETREDGRDE